MDVFSTVVASFFVGVVRVIDPKSGPIYSEAVKHRQTFFQILSRQLLSGYGIFRKACALYFAALIVQLGSQRWIEMTAHHCHVPDAHSVEAGRSQCRALE